MIISSNSSIIISIIIIVWVRVISRVRAVVRDVVSGWCAPRSGQHPVVVAHDKYFSLYIITWAAAAQGRRPPRRITSEAHTPPGSHRPNHSVRFLMIFCTIFTVASRGQSGPRPV